MDVVSEYLGILELCGRLTELDLKARWNREQRWREVYAARLHLVTGKWKWRGYDWHVFSFDYAAALEGDSAIEEYSRQRASELIIIPEQHSFP